MRALILILALVFSSQLLAEDLWTKDFKINLLQDERRKEIVVTITDVSWDNHCGFHATRISRSAFYAMLRRVAPIAEVVMDIIREHDPGLQANLQDWFDDMYNDESDEWLNEAGLHLMANLFNVHITTYGFRHDREQNSFDLTTITRTALYAPFPALRELLLANRIVAREQAADVEIFNNEGRHWQRIVVPHNAVEAAQPGWTFWGATTALFSLGSNDRQQASAPELRQRPRRASISTVEAATSNWVDIKRFAAVLIVFLSAFFLAQFSQVGR